MPTPHPTPARTVAKASNPRHSVASHKSVPCRYCHKLFLKSNLKVHLRIHTGEMPYSCKLCPRKFRRQDDLRRHNAIHLGDARYQCGICDKRFVVKQYLRFHMAIHKDVKPFECKECSKRFAHKGALVGHVKRVHEERERAFKCEQCGRSYKSKINLNRHRQTHTDVKPHGCVTCPKTFKTKAELERHTRTHTGERPYECDICHQRFVQSGARNNHRRTHTGEKPFQCEFCPQMFARKGDIAAHVRRKHTKDRRFSCGICDYTGADRTSLLKHMIVHTGVKEFVCGICQHACSAKNNLIVHMRTHTGEKPYTCDVCGERFSHQNSKKTHMLRKHPVGGTPERKINVGNKRKVKSKNTSKQKTSNDSRQNFDDGMQFAKDLNKHQATTGTSNLPVTVNVNHDAAYLNMQTKSDWKLKASVLSESCPAVVLCNFRNIVMGADVPDIASPKVSKAISISSNQNSSVNIDNYLPSDMSHDMSQKLGERRVEIEAINLDTHTDIKPEVTLAPVIEEVITID